jgi:hypothetical protein
LYCGRKAGRGKGDNECYSERKKNWSWGILPGARPKKSHLVPEVRAANEITRDYVRDKLYPSFL